MSAQVRPLIAIDGIDGSGKSYASAALAERCRERRIEPAVLAVDQFRQPLAWEAGADEAELYWSSYYDLDALERCLEACTGGAQSVAVPVFDSISEQITGERILDLSGRSVIILEGVFTLRVPAVRQSFLIYIHVSFEEARRRIIARDMPKGRSRAEVEWRIERRYFPAQRRYISELAPRARAQLVIDNERLGHPMVERSDLATLPPTLREAVASLV